LEEWFSFEDHASKHASKGPDIERVVISLQVNEKLGSFEVTRGHANIVLLPWVVKFGQTPINETQLAVLVINHNVVRLHISVHDAFRVAVVESLQDFKHVVANVKIVETLIKLAEISVACVHELSDNSRRLGQGISDNIDHVDNVSSMLECLQDFDLSSDLVLLDWFQDLNDNSLVGLRVNAFVDFGVLASSDLLDNLVVILSLELDLKTFIV